MARPTNDFDLRQLRYFIAVAEDMQFSRAASRLHIAQSTLSAQVRALETALDAELFARSSRSVQLTATGEALLDGGRKILEQLDELRAVVKAHGEGRRGSLRIGAVAPAMSRVVPSLLRAVCHQAPELDVRIETASTAVQIERILHGDLDVGFVRSIERRRGLRIETLDHEVLVAVLPRSHRLAGADYLHLHELDGKTFVFWPRSSNQEFFDAIIATCHQNDCVPDRIIENSELQSQLALIGAGLGVSVQPQSFVDASRTDIAVIPLHGNLPTFPLQIAWSGERDSVAVRNFVRLALEHRR